MVDSRFQARTDMSALTLNVNGKRHTIELPAYPPLL